MSTKTIIQPTQKKLDPFEAFLLLLVFIFLGAVVYTFAAKSQEEDRLRQREEDYLEQVINPSPVTLTSTPTPFPIVSSTRTPTVTPTPISIDSSPFVVFDSLSLNSQRDELILDGEVYLESNDEKIFEYFTKVSDLCTPFNYRDDVELENYCTDKDFFKQNTNFRTFDIDRRRTTLVLTVTSTQLEPDTMLIAMRMTKSPTVQLLTDFYLGNEFIEFSPSEDNFVYKTKCVEGYCGLEVRSKNSLDVLTSVNIEPGLRVHDAKFVEWKGEDTFSYYLGDQLYIEGF